MFFDNSFRPVAHQGQKSGDSQREERGGRLRAGTLSTTVMHKSQRLGCFSSRGMMVGG